MSRVDDAADRIVQWLDRHTYVVLGVATTIYGLVTCYRASRKLFWFDELFTIHVSRLPDVPSIWHALIGGADFNPPLLYILTRAGQAMLGGEGHIASRLPQIVGFWVFCLCLFRFVSVRTNALAGLIALGFPVVTLAYFYAYEARAHGIVLGFCGLALISWQAAADGRRNRLVPLAGLVAALAAALLTHAYAVLIFIPIVVGEAARSFTNRRVDWHVCTAILLAASAILVSVPLLIAVRSQLGVSVLLPASLSTLMSTYQMLFEPATPVAILTVVLLSVGYPLRDTARAARLDSRNLRPHEVAAALAFLAIPCVSYLLSRISGAPLVSRYSIAAVSGVACLGAIATTRRSVIGLLVLASLGIVGGIQLVNFRASTVIAEPSSDAPINTSRWQFDSHFRWIGTVGDTSLPIALMDNVDFAPSFRYAPRDIASRLFYLRYSGRDALADGWERLQRCCGAPGRVASLHDIRTVADTFLAYAPSRSFFRVHQLAENGEAVLSVKAMNGAAALFLVSYPPRAERPAHATTTGGPR